MMKLHARGGQRSLTQSYKRIARTAFKPSSSFFIFSMTLWDRSQERSSGVNHKTARKGGVSIKTGEKNKIK